MKYFIVFHINLVMTTHTNNMYFYCANNPGMGFDPNGNFSFRGLWNKVTSFIVDTVKKAVNKVVEYFLSKTDLDLYWGFGFLRNELRTGEIDELWDYSFEDGVFTVNMPSILNFIGIDSTFNFPLGCTKEDGLYFAVGHSMETAKGVMTTTLSTRFVPYALAVTTVNPGKYIKKKSKALTGDSLRELIGKPLVK